jgi:hypothetical protein
MPKQPIRAKNRRPVSLAAVVIVLVIGSNLLFL